MPTIRLTWTTTTNPDFGGFRFFVESGDVFDVDDYADFYGLFRSEIDYSDVVNAQAAASNLAPGEWLEVTHIEEED